MFSYPALLWALPVGGIVVLIHLINMFRHRRVPWAAMEFLLIGYKKSRARILLQQILLILLRTLAVLCIVLMLAQPKTHGPFADWIVGGKPTLHFVVLDDSFSMSDRNAGQVVMQDALSTLKRIVDIAARSGGQQKLTLLRFSKCAKNGTSEPQIPPRNAEEGIYDFDEQQLHEEGLSAVGARIGEIGSSEFSLGLEDVLPVVQRKISGHLGQYRIIVYLLSDFRARDWESPDSLVAQWEQLHNQGVGIRLIRMIDTHHSNLAVREVKPVPGIHASDIPILLDATIANFGENAVENVQFQVLVDGRSQSGQSVERILPGRESTVRFPIRLSGSGHHKVQVRLDPDAVSCDNEFSLVLEVPGEISVLLVSSKSGATPTAEPVVRSIEDRTNWDFGAESGDFGPLYLKVALSPEGVRTGIRIQEESPSFLNTNPIEKFDLVVVADIPSMENSAIRTLESFANKGGAVVFFTGPQCSASFVNENLYKEGKGLFPASLIAPNSLLPDYLSKEPDLNVVEHPMFRIFEKDGSPLLRAVAVEKYFSVNLTSAEAGKNGTVKVLGQLRNGSPLILENDFGRGKVITFLTTLAPLWNDWAQGNPSFVITMLEMVAYLTAHRSGGNFLRVGEPIELELDATRYDGRVNVFRPPPKSEDSSSENHSGDPIPLEVPGNVHGEKFLRFEATEKSGFYEIHLAGSPSGDRGEKPDDVRVFAVNVDYQEGNLALLDRSALSDILHPIGLRIEDANNFSAPFELTAAESLSEVLLFFVIVLLCGEMLLAGRILPPQNRLR